MQHDQNPIKTVFSGIQPSGELHLGNYLGAIRNWIQLQEEYRCLFCIVDLHAITQSYDKSLMKKRVLDMATDLLALGIDPQKSALFVQSQVPEHTELCWILNSVTSFGDLSRMTQFKDKSAKQSDNINVGLFDYPVLQAADILLYGAEKVPVGQDQVQHLELTRRIVRAFNTRWGQTFAEPEALLSATPKILGLDGKGKMSKSMNNTIPLSANDAQIKKALRKAATDPARVNREDAGDPDKCNVYTLHTFFSQTDIQTGGSQTDTLDWVQNGCRTAQIGCVDCKDKLTANIVSHLVPYRQRKKYFLEHPQEVKDILSEGADRVRRIAKKTMEKVRRRLGLWK